MAYFLGTLVYCLIFGFATLTISRNKGYEGGFWWGFLLGVIGLIIVACKPENRSGRSETTWNGDASPVPYAGTASPAASAPARPAMTAEQSEEKSNAETLAKLKKLHEQGILSEEEYNEKSAELRVSAAVRKQIRELRELTAQGLLSDEDFETKKQQLIEKDLDAIRKQELLSELIKLHGSGQLSKDEFQAKRKEILGIDSGMDPSTLEADIRKTVEELHSASEIYAYLNTVLDPSMSFHVDLLLKAVEGNARTERTYGNDKRGALRAIDKYYGSGMLAASFPRGAGKYVCPFCGNEQGVSTFCKQCNALFVTE